jgi:CSLREA domain-containing protein
MRTPRILRRTDFFSRHRLHDRVRPIRDRATRAKLIGLAAVSSGAVATLLLVAGEARLFSASTFVVNDTVDRLDSVPGDGVCRTSAGTCSLRAAIQEANLTIEADVIQLPAGLFTIARAPVNVNDITMGDFNITAPLTIIGAGRDATIVDGGRAPFGAPPEQTGLDRLFDLEPTAGRVTISNLTIRKGWAAGDGGAIHSTSRDIVRLIDVALVDNVARGSGGGVYSDGNEGGSLIVERSTIQGNSSGSTGGGLYVTRGSLTVSGTSEAAMLISGNHAAGDGGGVYNSGELNLAGQRGRVTISTTTISNNTSGSSGGGVANGLEGVLVMTDVLVSGNIAVATGGGVHVGSQASASITRASLTNNLAGGGGGAFESSTTRPVVLEYITCSGNGAGGIRPGTEVVEGPDGVELLNPGRDTPILADGTLLEPADEGGGCLYVDGAGTVNVSNSDFFGNLGVGDGGAIGIHSLGAVTIADSRVYDNLSYMNGGGIHNSGMRVTLNRLTVRNNHASEEGGGIQNESSGEFAILDTSILSNTASNAGGLNIVADSTMRISGTLFWDNRAQCSAAQAVDCGYGGGIYHGSDGAFEIQNSTVSTNIAQTAGGGVFVDADAGLHFVNSTVTLNSAPSGAGFGIPTSDILLFPWPQPAPGVRLRNTIVAGNVGGPDCAVPFTSEGGNIDGGAQCGFVGLNDRQNVLRPALLALADNGGPTMTHALASSSIAVDSALAPCLQIDQRGVTRPQHAGCDIGAYEYSGPLGTPDTTPPDTLIVEAPLTTDGFGIFRFAGVDAGTAPDEFLFQCRITNFDPLEPPDPIDPTVPPPPPGQTPDPYLDWVACANPLIIDNSHLTPGASPYELREGFNQILVRAIDRAGNVDPTPAVHSWTDTTDTIPPETTLLSGPPPTTTSRSATFSFAGTDNLTQSGLLEYECRIDGQLWDQIGECANPAMFSNLSLGVHTFEVRALDLADNVDLTPARWTWTILPPTTCEDANINLPAVADTWIDEYEPAVNWGIDIGLRVRSEALNRNARALVGFDLPTDLPQCQLESATLRLFSQGGAEGRALKAVPLAGPWQEMGVTWSNQPPAASVGPRDDAGQPAPSVEAWQEWDVTAYVAAMLSGGMPNYGFMVRDVVEGSEGGGETVFSSKDTIADVPQTPQLALRFAPVDPNSATPPPPRPEAPIIPTVVTCGQILTQSTLVANDLVDCPDVGLVAGASNIMIDLGGHTIDGINYMPPDPTQPLSPGSLMSGQEEGLPAGIRISGMSNVVVTNGTVQEFGSGVQLTPGTIYSLVEYVTLARNAIAGVELVDADNGTVGNEVRDNYFVGNVEGVFVRLGSEKSAIYRNRFEANFGASVIMNDAQRHRIEGNFMTGFQPNPLLSGSDVGVRMEGSSDNLIRGNTIEWAGDAGVYLTEGSHRNLIEGNTMSHAGDAGVFVESSNANQILNNIAHKSSDAGVHLGAAHDTVVLGNDVRWNPAGVTVSGGNNNVVQSNDASEGTGGGIQVNSAARLRVLNNVANMTAGDGISVEGDVADAAGNVVPGVLIQGNTTNQNAKDGISVQGLGHTVTANDAHNNVEVGISAEGVTDGGGNRASGNNLGMEQCIGVVCDSSMAVPLVAPDTTRPDTVITVAPPDGASTLTAMRFEFTGTDNHAPATALTFSCRLDGGPDPAPEPQDPAEPPSAPVTEGWQTCASPMWFTNLSVGPHTFQVRAEDPAHNFDWEPATYTWTVSAAAPGEADITPPQTTITSAPADGSLTSVSIGFSGLDDVTPGFDLRFECSLDGGAFVSCTSPAPYTVALGTHTIQVRATDLAGNTDPSPASHTWTVSTAPLDITAPETTITSQPDPITVATSAAFTFSSSENGTNFLCSLDGAAATLCDSPVTYSGLSAGHHTLAVQAIDAAGNIDPTPAIAAWQIGATPERATVVCGEVLQRSVILMNDLVDCPDYGLVAGADGITIDLNGFTIDGRGSAGAGILTQGHDYVTITNGTVQEFAFGIRLTPGTTHSIVSSIRLFSHTTAGIELSDADDNEIRTNVLIGNDTGIAVLNGTQRSLLRGNIIGSSSEHGIRVGGLSSQIVIDTNEINTSAEHAILLEGVRQNTLSGNVMSGNAEYAIAVASVADPVDPLVSHAANGNRVEANFIVGGYGGIWVVGIDGAVPVAAEGNEVIGNGVYETTGPGVKLETATGTLVQSNQLLYNGEGISLSESSDNRIEANDASDSAGAGISVSEASFSNVIVANLANDNTTNGIEVMDPATGSAGNVLERNATGANGGNGVYVPGTGHTITANTADHNVGWGIWVELGNVDGGGNYAIGNDGGSIDPATGAIVQCYNIACSATPLADMAPPETVLTSGPANPTVDHSAIFTFGGLDALTPVTSLTYQCRLDSQSEADFAACTSPVSYSSLLAGAHTFEVRAVDAVGNVDASPAVYTWTITPPGIAPETTITSGPDAQTVSSTATFTFSSNEPGATFACSLDGASFVSCASPQSYEVAVGSHTFAVAATDLEGLTDATPAVSSWIVGAPAVPTTVSCGQVLTQSTRVMNDLIDCPADGLIVGAHGITIDLNGHMIDGVQVGAGIRNAGFDNVTITDGTVAGGGRDSVEPPAEIVSGIKEFETGIFLASSATDNIVSALNVTASKLVGIHLSDADGATIRGNALWGNEVGIAVLDGTEGALVLRNHLTAGLETDILVVGSLRNRFEGNVITASVGAGIVLEFARENQLVANTVSGSPSASGVQFLNASNANRLERNTLTGNQAGVLISASDANEVIDNIIRQNLGVGIDLELANAGIIRGNDVRENVTGISLLDSSNNRVEANNESGSTGSGGIVVEGNSSSNVITGNQANDGLGDGISVASASVPGSGNVIEHNTASGNTGDGIQVSAAVHTVTANVADSNGGWGIYAIQGNMDGGGNQATGNGEPAQCFTIVCTSGTVAGHPDTLIVEHPPNPSTSRYATFTFTGTDNTDLGSQLSFECRVDSQDPLAWSEVGCENPTVLSNLSAGTHTFEVRAIDTLGLVDPTPASYTWTVEPLPSGVAPDTIITSGPALSSMQLEAIFIFAATEPDVYFECALDAMPFTPCGVQQVGLAPSSTGGIEYEFLESEAGPHRFQVRAIDLEGNADPTPAVYDWTINGVITVITSGPAFIPPTDPTEPASGGETADTTATFTFTANVDATFTCSIDMQPFVSCTSPVTYSGLAPGMHLFQVIATGPDGAEQLEPTEYEWDIAMPQDTTPPETILTVVPANSSADAMFEFTGTDNYTPASRLLFECRLDSTNVLDWTACVSPFNLLEIYPTLAPGTHTFEVRAIDEGLGGTGTTVEIENIDPTPATYTWTYVLDTMAPETAIVIGPAAATLEPTVEFTFAGNDGNQTPLLLITYECSVDGAAFAPCSSPYSVTVPELGSHTLLVRAIDIAGNVDATPASYTWTLQAPPSVLIESAPGSLSSSTVTFAFTADQAGALFACSLDGGPFATCTSPVSYSNLVAGPHVFAVRAADAAGNAGDVVTYQWVVEGVDVTPPNTTIVGGPGLTTVLTFATFTVTASETGSSFLCALDGAAFAPCSESVDYVGVAGGSHTFAVYAVDASGNADPTPATYTWTVVGAGAPPETTIISGPLDVPGQPDSLENTTATTATFVFESNLAGSTFECILGQTNPFTEVTSYGLWTPCSSPYTYAGLQAGLYEFQVRATANGVTDPSPADYNWEIVAPELSAPRTSLDNGPAAITELTDATFEFSAYDAVTGDPEPLATFECSFDGSAWAECFSPISFTGLAAGEHTFSVRATDAQGTVDPTPETYNWVVEGVAGPPDTFILSGPVAVTASTEALFTLTSSLLNVTFECSLDGGAYEACGSPVVGLSGTPIYYTEEIGSLLAGPHTLQVRAVHEVYGTDPSPASYSWTMDPAERIAPNTTILSRPAAVTVSSSATFAFTADETVLLFECSLDGAPVTSCTSPYDYPLLAEGTHTFTVRAIDLVGNADPTPATFTWTIIAPADVLSTTVLSGPPAVTDATTATFIFSASAQGSTFECALDGAGFAACTSPVEYTALSDGFHTFQVVATDPQGNQDPTPAAYTWTVTTQPLGPSILDTTILSGPTLTTTSTSATFEFASALAASFECALDGGAFAACASPAIYADLALGVHTFDVRALDATGTADPTPARYGWTVLADTSLLNTQILSGPALTTTSTSATFNVSSNRGSSYECSLDGAAFSACTPPVTYADLAAGAHLFSVRAVDATGVDLTPATYNWTVEAAAVALQTTIQSGPSAVTATGDATFVFSAVEPEVTFECALDGGVFEECVSPMVYNDLLEGAHQFQVRAVDAALNVGPLASYVWTVQFDTSGPVTTLLAGPATLSGSPDAIFTFSASDPLASFECSLDGAPFEACDVPAVYGDLLAGEHTFQVRAINEALVAGAPVSYTWTVVGEPETTILLAPASPSGTETATFVFSSDQPGTFECSLNGAPFAPCVSPFEARGLIEDTHEFQVQAVNTYGVIDQTPAIHTWTVQLPADVEAPDTTITVGPSGINGSVTVAFEFAGTDNRTLAIDLEFECSLDGEPFAGCSSPMTLDLISALTGLELPGDHTFAVRAVDAAGNVDATPAIRTWTFVDVMAPETVVLSGPPSETEATTATFTFDVEVPEPGVTFECSVDGAAFVACASPYTVSGLTPGLHIFQVRAIDAVGNIESLMEVYEWTIDPALDTVPPDTIIVAGPTSPTAATEATFVFVATEANTTFECSLDGGAFSECSSPHTVDGVSAGTHTLQVRAVDAGGHTDATPASFSWTTIGAPDTTILSGPQAQTGATTATFTFSSNEPTATFQCFVNGDGPIPCSSPYTALGLLEGPQTFRVQAVVTLGVTSEGLPATTIDPTPATFSWEVGLSPDTAIVSVNTLPVVAGESPILQFVFTGTDDMTLPLDLEYECSLDGGTFQGCSSGHEIDTAELSAGSHTLAVRAVDSGDHVDPTPATYTFSTAGIPETTILTFPATNTDATTATFTFSSSQSNVTFECSTEPEGAFTSCTSPVTLIGLGYGPHLFQVQARSAVGVVDPSPAVYEWVRVSLTAPVVTITSGPAGPADPTGLAGSTEQTSATFTFTLENPTGVPVVLLCSLDGGPAIGCQSPMTYTGLLAGPHAFQVEADSDYVLTPAPEAAYNWTITDLVAPDTQLLSGPALAGGGATAVITFTGTDNAPAIDLAFECALDGAAFSACTSPVELTELAAGVHTLLVRAVDGTLLVDQTPASYTWTVVAPETTILSAPPAISLGEVEFQLAGSHPTTPAVDLTLECSLDGAPYSDCSSPLEISGLAPGSHTLLFRAVDELNADASPATYAWSVDEAPETTITAGPAATSDSPDATFVFSGVDNGAAALTFECSLDGAAFAACSSPYSLTGLGAGEHAFAVHARDSAGFIDLTPATYQWSISAVADTTPPDTALTSSPSGTVTATDATFTFTATEPNATFECALDAGAFAACSSPSTLAGLAGGTHTFAVRAVDTAGNADASPATATWTIGVPPETTILSGPADVVEATSATTATFTFSSSDAAATFACSLDLGAFAPCASPLTLSGLTEGPHELLVRAVGASGLVDPTPDDYEWVIDLTPPTTGIIEQPPATSTVTSARFTVASNDPGATFQCSLDGAAFAACQATVDYAALSVGSHTFAVRAVDAAGNVDATPASYSWTIAPLDTTPPDTTIASGPATPTTVTSATFTFSANEPDVTFECALDGASFAACASPVSYSNLGLGAHTLAVRGIDAVGNVEAAPAIYSWTIEQVNCGAPVTLTAIADAWMEQSSPSQNKGDDSTLKVRSKNGAANARALVNFSLPQLPPGCAVQAATLRMESPSAVSGRTLRALRVAAAWSENVVTWSNQPATAGTPTTTASGTGLRQWNVLTQVREMYDLNAAHGFLIRDATEGAGAGPEQSFHSRESSVGRPQLVVTFAPQ